MFMTKTNENRDTKSENGSCHVCSEGHILKEKKRVTRLEYMCILGNKIECISTLKKRLSMKI